MGCYSNATYRLWSGLSRVFPRDTRVSCAMCSRASVCNFLVLETTAWGFHYSRTGNQGEVAIELADLAVLNMLSCVYANRLMVVAFPTFKLAPLPVLPWGCLETTEADPTAARKATMHGKRISLQRSVREKPLAKDGAFALGEKYSSTVFSSKFVNCGTRPTCFNGMKRVKACKFSLGCLRQRKAVMHKLSY